MKEYFDLFLCFLKLGATNFGGGYAMLPILVKEIDEKRHWATTQELMDYFAIGQCTPGTIAINVASFIGYKRKKIPGAILASVGFVTVPVILIIIIASLLSNFAQYKLVQDALSGIRICVCLLIVNSVMTLWKKSIVDKITLFVYIFIFSISAFSGFLPVHISPVILVIAAGIFGITRTNKLPEEKDKK
ncbi:chromate transporter [Acetitomaculum ruminis DSM 5522]|uniref:Chromate transporter n=1 Tax=Acetitomaculum ruminis DSM 5522 TaxID=1120918 RepID=A0A1I1A8T4_9FIRM|nr:chromate transporter [Acetitomaculum ruminis]SFB32833.1 chromate transporter [Acetitomaculum ruminis DSM 5522]